MKEKERTGEGRVRGKREKEKREGRREEEGKGGERRDEGEERELIWFLFPLGKRNSKRPPYSKNVTIVLFFLVVFRN